LRLLSNLQTEKQPLLQVILVGQPGLRDRLRHPALRQLAQRVALHYHLNPLDKVETKEYIQFRLARAGGSGIFTAAALDKLYNYTQGVPRRINAWCDLALVAGFAEGRHELDGEFIDLIIATQGGSLEGLEAAGEEEAPPQKVLMEKGNPVDSASVNGLKAQILELAGRLTRMEGLLLEITGELVPAMALLIQQQKSERVFPSEDQLNFPGLDDPTRPPFLENRASSSRRWWSRVWIKKIISR
jgi:general secretion pathway protein A